VTVRLRQLALVATDLPAAERQIADRLGLSLCFRDPGVGEFGLVNALWPVGDQLLEVVSPDREGTTAGRLIDRRGGDGGYMVIVQAESFTDVERLRDRLPGLGVRVIWKHDNDKMAATHVHPKDVGGAILSIDAANPPERWDWAGPASWRDHIRTDIVRGFAGVEIGADDPAAMAARWADALDAPLAADGTTVQLSDAVVAFVPAGPRGEGVDGIRFHAADRTRAGESFDLVGLRATLV
jgi:hypothetical protein